MQKVNLEDIFSNVVSRKNKNMKKEHVFDEAYFDNVFSNELKKKEEYTTLIKLCEKIKEEKVDFRKKEKLTLLRDELVKKYKNKENLALFAFYTKYIAIVASVALYIFYKLTSMSTDIAFWMLVGLSFISFTYQIKESLEMKKIKSQLNDVSEKLNIISSYEKQLKSFNKRFNPFVFAYHYAIKDLTVKVLSEKVLNELKYFNPKININKSSLEEDIFWYSGEEIFEVFFDEKYNIHVENFILLKKMRERVLKEETDNVNNVIKNSFKNVFKGKPDNM